MPVISCYVSDKDMETLEEFSKEHNRKIDELCEAAISEQCSQVRRTKPMEKSS